MQKRFDVLLVEGAGGLLSPLGENFDSRDLIFALRATPIIVAQNKLGAVNHVLLTLEALPEKSAVESKNCFDVAAKTGRRDEIKRQLLAQFMPPGKIFSLPWLGENFHARRH